MSQVDIRLRVKGGGFTGQIYALRQARHYDVNSIASTPKTHMNKHYFIVSYIAYINISLLEQDDARKQAKTCVQDHARL